MFTIPVLAGWLAAEPPAAPACPPALDLPGIVGAEWSRLPPALRRRFAVHHGAARYCGTLSLERSAIGGWFAWLLKPFGSPLPRERTCGAPVEVRVQPQHGGVVWERRFGPGQIVRSVKSPGPSGTVLERTDGGFGMVLDVLVADGALLFTSRSFFLSVGRWRLPIPALLTPGCCRVEHRAIDDSRFLYTLTMTHPLWGRTFRQSGIFADDAKRLP